MKTPRKVLEKNAAWRRANIDKVRDSDYRRKYGIELEAVQLMAEMQGNACRLCNRASADSYRGLHLDHDHATGRIRGLLCHFCNTALGKFNDDAALLRRAATYVETYRGS